MGNIPELMTWTVGVLESELMRTTSGASFFILTNSRAFLITEICTNLRSRVRLS